MNKIDWQEKGKGHRGRLRDRFLANGLSGFHDVEIIELLLSFGTPRSDCKEQARALLAKYGSFAKVLEAPSSSLLKVKGVGVKNSFALSFVHAVAAHYLKDRIRGKRYLHSSADVLDYLTYSMRGLKSEVLTVIFLDSSHAIIESEVVAQGTINVNAVYPREIIKKSFEYNAAALIFAHNHPSGAINPSVLDIKLTKTMFLLCSNMQLRLVDHIIVGETTFSFADNGLMEKIKTECNSTMEKLHTT